MNPLLKPDHVQVGFGSGFKCNSLVWRALRDIHDTQHAAWAHMAQPGQQGQDTSEMWALIRAPAPAKASSCKEQPLANGHAASEPAQPGDTVARARSEGFKEQNGIKQDGPGSSSSEDGSGARISSEVFMQSLKQNGHGPSAVL